jgi:hypothetical protein
LTFALDVEQHAALFFTAFFAGAFFAAFLTAIPLSSFLVYARDPCRVMVQPPYSTP